jgi:hypothetical protein
LFPVQRGAGIAGADQDTEPPYTRNNLAQKLKAFAGKIGLLH